jgi:sodium transport system permease protein
VQHDTSFASTLALGAVRSEVAAYNDLILSARLASLGHDRGWLAPITLDETQAATSVAAASTSGITGGNSANAGIGAIFLPLALTSWLIGGGLGLIVDTTVGEKERQTIEALLVTPASRTGMVIGKLSAVMIVSLIVMGLWMLEGVFLSVVGQAGPQLLAAQGLSVSTALNLIAQSGVSIGGLIVVLLMLFVPFVIVLNGLVMAFCSVASSYRESNGFLFLLQLAVPALVLISIFSISPDAGLGWYAAPVMGTILSIRDLFSQTLTPAKLLISVISTSLYAAAAIGLVVYVYSRDWALSRR